MSYECKILADSASLGGVRLTTMQVTFPRIVLAEFNTHRVFSRNSASSRAIPVEKQIARVMEDPVVPVYWGKNQKGMQAEKELTAEEIAVVREDWLTARNAAVDYARLMLAMGVHKQITNRLLEPFMWHTVIVTATEWENFFALRCNPMAQPEIRVVAEMMRDEYARSTPVDKRPGEWHLPLVPDYVDLTAGQVGYSEKDIARISCGRCARVSYLTHNGVRDPSADLDLAERLRVSGHMSPFEHAAVVAETHDEVFDELFWTYEGRIWESHFIGNFRAPWVQYRKLLPNEEVFRG